MPSAGTYLQIRNFEQFQHYKDRRPPWIKLYANLLDDDRFFDLTDAERYQLIGLFILASQHDNKIPNKANWLQHQLRTSKTISLEKLIDTGWIRVMEQDASGVLAECLHDASPRARAERREEKSRGEEKEPLAISSPVAAVEYSNDFEMFWKRSTRRGSKVEAFREYRKFSKSIETLAAIQAGMFAWQQSEQWQDESKQPHICRWLKRRGWEEIVPNGNHRQKQEPIIEAVEGSRRGGELSKEEAQAAMELIALRRQRGEG